MDTRLTDILLGSPMILCRSHDTSSTKPKRNGRRRKIQSHEHHFPIPKDSMVHWRVALPGLFTSQINGVFSVRTAAASPFRRGRGHRTRTRTRTRTLGWTLDGDAHASGCALDEHNESRPTSPFVSVLFVGYVSVLFFHLSYMFYLSQLSSMNIEPYSLWMPI